MKFLFLTYPPFEKGGAKSTFHKGRAKSTFHKGRAKCKTQL